MQRYRIVHQNYYNFSTPVSLEAHEVLLRPREDHTQRIESFSLRISPESNLLWHRDVEGNSVAIADFRHQSTQQLAIESEVIVQQFNEYPLDFIVADYAVDYPFSYLEDDATLLNPYRVLEQPEAQGDLDSLISSVWQISEKIQTFALLLRIARHINATCTYNVREEPGVQSVNKTLNIGAGSCRDFAYLFMEVARRLGLAARFVSGYLYVPGSTLIGSTHAWAEIYLPGAGWLGFDPTIGVVVGADHFPVAVSHLPEAVPPISGTFRGAAQSTLEVGVWVSRY